MNRFSRLISTTAVIACIGGAVAFYVDYASRTTTRIAISPNDTLVINGLKPVHIPIHAYDSKGRSSVDARGRFRYASGDSIALTADGRVTCSRVTNTKVTITLGALAQQSVLRCMPVGQLYMSYTPMQLVVGEDAQRIPVVAVGLDGKLVDMIAGRVQTRDGSVVDIEPGLRIRAKIASGSLTTVYVGDLRASVGVHTFDRVQNLDNLQSNRRPVAMKLRLVGGEVQRFPLPSGIWMLTMLPYEDEKTGLRLRVLGANCLPTPVTPRRITCETIAPATLVISHPVRGAAHAIDGEIFLDPESRSSNGGR